MICTYYTSLANRVQPLFLQGKIQSGLRFLAGNSASVCLRAQAGGEILHRSAKKRD